METRILEKYNDLVASINSNSKNEVINSKFCVLVNMMVDFCSTEGSLFKVYRILKRIEADLSIILQNKDITPGKFLIKLLSIIKTEEDIVIYQFKNPDLIDRFTSPEVPPVRLHWTDDKVSLVELIYAVLPSVNNGKASVKSLIDCFSYLFQIDLSGSYRMLSDINLRKTNVTRYLDSLPGNLLKQLERLNK